MIFLFSIVVMPGSRPSTASKKKTKKNLVIYMIVMPSIGHGDGKRLGQHGLTGFGFAKHAFCPCLMLSVVAQCKSQQVLTCVCVCMICGKSFVLMHGSNVNQLT